MPEPNLNQVHVDRPLTNISVAYIQSAADFIADKVFPVVPVEKQSDRYFVYNKGDWFRDEAQVRAPGTESAGGGYTIDNTPSYYAPVYAYHKDVDEQVRSNTDVPLNADRDAVEFVTQRMLLRRERQWAANYFKTGVWGLDLTGEAAAPGANQFLQWNQANSTPVEDIDTQIYAIKEGTGFKPNVLTIGPDVFRVLKNHPEILDRIKYTERGIVTEDILAAVFGVDKVLVASASYNSAAQGAADAMSFIFGKNVLLTYAEKNPGLQKPSAGYIFTWTGLLGAGAYGSRISRIPMPWLGQQTERIEGELAFDAKVVGADLGVFFNTAVA
ncbi:MAG: major capsid protein [Patescibacteria group bacterium]|nr:major capsid protein [Patescibacteria group bacterium]